MNRYPSIVFLSFIRLNLQHLLPIDDNEPNHCHCHCHCHRTKRSRRSCTLHSLVNCSIGIWALFWSLSSLEAVRYHRRGKIDNFKLFLATSSRLTIAVRFATDNRHSSASVTVSNHLKLANKTTQNQYVCPKEKSPEWVSREPRSFRRRGNITVMFQPELVSRLLLRRRRDNIPLPHVWISPCQFLFMELTPP